LRSTHSTLCEVGRVNMPQGCYRCDLKYFQAANTCHWIYLTHEKDEKLVKAGKSRGLTICGQGANKEVYAPLCQWCVGWYLLQIRVGATGSEHDVMAKAVLEYVGDQVVSGKLQGGYDSYD